MSILQALLVFWTGMCIQFCLVISFSSNFLKCIISSLCKSVYIRYICDSGAYNICWFLVLVCTCVFFYNSLYSSNFWMKPCMLVRVCLEREVGWEGHYGLFQNWSSVWRTNCFDVVDKWYSFDFPWHHYLINVMGDWWLVIGIINSWRSPSDYVAACICSIFFICNLNVSFREKIWRPVLWQSIGNWLDSNLKLNWSSLSWELKE